MHSLPRTLVAAGFLFALSSCAGSAQLAASDGSHRLVASDSAHGLTVVLTTEAWEENDMGDELTIVHVLISNMGSQPVLLAPGDFELRDMRGFAYSLRDSGAAFHSMAPGQSPDQVPPTYQRGRNNDFESIRAPDGSLGRLALPWGELQPGTQMRGFIYFDDLRKTANHAVLAWYSQTPDHRPLADFGFRLHVARPH
jgi:hypothetical protein